jgi:hypothetical protein
MRVNTSSGMGHLQEQRSSDRQITFNVSKECAEHESCSLRRARRDVLAPPVRHARNQVDA